MEDVFHGGVLKRLVPVALALVVLCVLAVFAGCKEGGDTREARSLVKSGDANYTAFGEEFPELADLSEKLFARFSQGVETGPAEAKGAIQDYQDRFNKLLERVERAKAPYRKVLAMEGVKAYKEYARLRLKMLSKIEEAGGVLAKTFPMIEKVIRTGGNPDASALEGSKRELIGIEMELSFIDVEAEQLAKDSGLLK